MRWICMGKTPIASLTYENERISIKKKKNSLPYINCVLLLSCVVHGPIYGRFMGFLDTGGVVPAGSPNIKPDQNSFFYTHF